MLYLLQSLRRDFLLLKQKLVSLGVWRSATAPYDPFDRLRVMVSGAEP